MTKARLKRLWVWVAALVALVLLAGSLAQVEFGYGSDPLFPNLLRLTRINASDVTDELPEKGEPVYLDFWDILFRIFFWVLLPISVVYYVVSAVLSSEGRWRALAVVIGLLLLLAFIVAMRGLAVEPVEVTPTPLAGELGPPPEIELPEVTSPEWLIWGIRVLLAVVLVGGGWFLLRRFRRPASRPLRELAEHAEEALEEVRAGVSLKDVVLRSYLEMTRILSEQRGIQRKAHMTPREFERRLEEIGLPRQHVHRLTQLFERVRYGAKAPGLTEEREAIFCLTAIVEACRESP